MADKILLSTYVITVEKKKVPQQLDSLIDNQNFIEIFEDFCMNIMKHPFIPKTKGVSTNRNLTIPSSEILKGQLPFNLDSQDLSIRGYFQAGAGGDNFNIMNTTTNNREFIVKSTVHISTKNIFYYLHVPKDSTEGFLVLQKIRSFGIKTDLKTSLQYRLKDILPKGCIIKIHNRIPYSLYEEMINYGDLKKIDFIKNTVPQTMKDFISNNKQARRVKGTMTQTLKMKDGFGREWKDKLTTILTSKDLSNQRIDFPEDQEYFDEVSFEIELNGKIKTFHAINKAKVQPSIDVTKDVIMDQNNTPTIESLIAISKELIKEILTITPKHV